MHVNWPSSFLIPWQLEHQHVVVRTAEASEDPVWLWIFEKCGDLTLGQVFIFIMKNSNNDDVWEQGAEEKISTYGSNARLEKTA